MQLHCLNNAFNSIYTWPRTPLVLETSCSSYRKVFSLSDRIKHLFALIVSKCRRLNTGPVTLTSSALNDIESDPSERSAIIEEDKGKHLAHRDSGPSIEEPF